MTFDEQTTGLLLVVALALCGILALVVGWLAWRLHRLHRDYDTAMGDGENVFATLAEHRAGIEGLRSDMGTVHRNSEMLRELLRNVTSRTAVVRYDAFEDMGGAMSFSAALLDEHDNGLVITSINGRAETRTYAKPIVAGTSDYSLSDDERRAIVAAQSQLPSAPDGGRQRRGGRKVAS